MTLREAMTWYVDILENIMAITHEPYYYGYGPGSEELYLEEEGRAHKALLDALRNSSPEELAKFKPNYWREERIVENYIKHNSLF